MFCFYLHLFFAFFLASIENITASPQRVKSNRKASKSPSLAATNRKIIASVSNPTPEPINIKSFPVNRCSLLIAIPPKITIIPPKRIKIISKPKIARIRYLYSGYSDANQSLKFTQASILVCQPIIMKSIPEINE